MCIMCDMLISFHHCSLHIWKSKDSKIFCFYFVLLLSTDCNFIIRLQSEVIVTSLNENGLNVLFYTYEKCRRFCFLFLSLSLCSIHF